MSAARCFHRGLSVHPDQLSGVGAYIDREYGCEGYRVEAIESHGPISAFRVRCSDGGRFFVIADKWGNCESLGCEGYDAESFDNPKLLAAIDIMLRKAVAI